MPTGPEKVPEYPTVLLRRPSQSLYLQRLGGNHGAMKRRVSRAEALVAAGVLLGSLLACKQDKKDEGGTDIHIGKSDKAEGVSVETDEGKVNVGASKGNCKPGETCACTGIGSCEKTCAGKGCAFSCEGMGACELNCPEGDCKATSTALGSTQLKCPGGGCSLECKSAGSCQLTECKSGCKITCGGAGECSCTSGCS